MDKPRKLKPSTGSKAGGRPSRHGFFGDLSLFNYQRTLCIKLRSRLVMISPSTVPITTQPPKGERRSSGLFSNELHAFTHGWRLDQFDFTTLDHKGTRYANASLSRGFQPRFGTRGDENLIPACRQAGRAATSSCSLNDKLQ